MTTLVRGYCPWGCGTTLYLNDQSEVACFHQECPQPLGVTELLSNPETQHVAEFKEKGFTVRHPLRERIHDELFTCYIHTSIPPSNRLGRYRVTNVEGKWIYQHIDTCEHGTPLVSETPSAFADVPPVRLYKDGCQKYGPYGD